MKKLLALAFVLVTTSIANAAPLLNGAAQMYDVNTCVNSASTSCTGTTNNTYGASAVCFAYDLGANNPVTARCGVSGNTVTVTMAPTVVSGLCTMAAATTCTWTLPYATSSSLRCTTTDVTNPVAAKCSVSGTTVTITAASSNSDSWHTLVQLTVPSATGHTFEYFVIQ